MFDSGDFPQGHRGRGEAVRPGYLREGFFVEEVSLDDFLVFRFELSDCSEGSPDFELKRGVLLRNGVVQIPFHEVHPTTRVLLACDRCFHHFPEFPDQSCLDEREQRAFGRVVSVDRFGHRQERLRR